MRLSTWVGKAATVTVTEAQTNIQTAKSTVPDEDKAPRFLAHSPRCSAGLAAVIEAQ
jgi:hypothetical protein